MKLVSFSYEGNTRIGMINGEQVIDLNYAYRTMLEAEGVIRSVQVAEAFVPANMVEFLQGGEQSMELVKKAIDYAQKHGYAMKYKVFHRISEVKIEAPVRNPGKIICVGHNYREHILEMGRGLPDFPVVFAKFGNTIVGPQDDIPFYPVSEQLDYEAEFAFVIGKRARNVSQADALQYVAGYTIVNDVTYRDIQRRTIQWLQGKTVEGSAPMGPWLVTADELLDPAGLEIVLTVNGEQRQRSNTANLVFSVPYLVEFLSNLMTLEPGDVILTGTPGGVGVAREPEVFLKDGDVVRIEIDRIGMLENTVKKTECV
ncbi:2-hydroxyhepta-2,4-diene-1,7-dioate isomerase [Paenibacillus sp. Soil766]|uniref:fumarylacetoacetate hydrolase family protein n=1 Tax=Paenibacillus sp. Soil766 TaxID=1736404 RepID=UPI00070C5A01|nr:fumarylacetoacetate hydrolase family protein [Paenibacillus sp. Soil766]KRE82388.1 2-hydroxyhepta-2,4-diene-1,7-dioate isomerase [Paenibacillus sp. Soil766]